MKNIKFNIRLKMFAVSILEVELQVKCHKKWRYRLYGRLVARLSNQ
jgi:hypothetical protein